MLDKDYQLLQVTVDGDKVYLGPTQVKGIPILTARKIAIEKTCINTHLNEDEQARLGRQLVIKRIGENINSQLSRGLDPFADISWCCITDLGVHIKKPYTYQNPRFDRLIFYPYQYYLLKGEQATLVSKF